MAIRIAICRGEAVSLTRIEQIGDGDTGLLGLGSEGFFQPYDGSWRQAWSVGILLLWLCGGVPHCLANLLQLPAVFCTGGADQQVEPEFEAG
jgi:hypothetical protein